jgi:hypothetical protein
VFVFDFEEKNFSSFRKILQKKKSRR